MSAVDGARERHEQPLKTTISITEPGYYRIGQAVRQLTCLNSRYSIIDRLGITGLHAKSLFAPATHSERDPQTHWVHVTQEMIIAGDLQFEVHYDADADVGQLLARDLEKETLAVDAIARMRTGVAVRASRAGGVDDGTGLVHG